MDFLYYFALICFVMGIFVSTLKINPKVINYSAHGASLVGCIMALLCAYFIFSFGNSAVFMPEWLFFGTFEVYIDQLSAFFLLIMGIVGGCVSLYAIGYCKEYYKNHLNVMVGLWNAFLLSIMLVITVSNGFMFIVVWECMSIVSFLLVLHEHEKKFTKQAAYLYLIMTHFGTVFIITAFLILGNLADSLSYISLFKLETDINTQRIVFLCVFLGFGVKAGLMPMHIWLPKAHPAAPSHISAIMSGLMLKTAVYGFCRFLFNFLSITELWWGLLIISLAVLSSVLGILYASVESHIKKMLAYSSVENLGMIFLGIGVGVVFISEGMQELGKVALIAAFIHCFNHAIYKSLLFMGAGSILTSVHTVEMDMLGGLMKKMPYTGTLFLIGSLAIAAIPPMNGFISEWMLLQSVISWPAVFSGMSGLFGSALLLACIGLTGALSAACFLKTIGTVFLGKPRSQRAENANEVSKLMLVPMTILAGLCIVIGVQPSYLILLCQQVINAYTEQLIIVDTPSLLYFHINSLNSNLSILVFIFCLLTAGIIAILLTKIFGTGKVKIAATWTCGMIPTSRMQYSSIGFIKPTRRIFHLILMTRKDIIKNNNKQYWGEKFYYNMNITYVFLEHFYRPLQKIILQTAKYMRRIQAGSVHLYISYLMIATVASLIWCMKG